MANEGSKQVHGWAMKAIREAMNLSQKAVAIEAGVSQPYLCQIESGIREWVSEKAFAGFLKALRIRDKRAIMAAPRDVDSQVAS